MADNTFGYHNVVKSNEAELSFSSLPCIMMMYMRIFLKLTKERHPYQLLLQVMRCKI